MPLASSFRDLEVWEESMLLVEDVYRLSRDHLDIGLGSQAEVDVQLEIALRLAYLPKSDYRTIVARVDRVGRMLNGLIRSLQPVEEDWR